VELLRPLRIRPLRLAQVRGLLEGDPGAGAVTDDDPVAIGGLDWRGSPIDDLSALEDGDSLHAAGGTRGVRADSCFAARCRHGCRSYLRSTGV
jgi:hypothetical protein